MPGNAGSAVITIRPDLSTFRADLRAGIASATAGQSGSVRITPDTSTMRADIAAAIRAATLGQSGSVRITANTSGVAAGAREIATGFNLAAAAALALGPAIVSVGAALAPVVGLAGVLPGLLVGLAQVGGTTKLAFGGIGEAIKAGDAATKSFAATSHTAATKQVADAGAIRSAQDSVASATRGLAAAQRNATYAAQQAAEARKRAERDVSDAVSAAAKTQLADLEAVGKAQERVTGATKSLNQARREAVQDLIDLRNAEKDAAISAQQASLDLTKAREREKAVNESSTSTQDDKDQARLDVQAAEQKAAESKGDSAKATKDLNDAEAKGVEGSDKVTSAKQAQADAYRDLQDAQRKQREDEVAGDRAIMDAEQKLEDARRAQKRAALDSADAIAGAQQSLRASQRGLSEAGQRATSDLTAVSPAASAAATALGRLTPAGRAFVEAFKAAREEIRQLQRIAQEATLPGFTHALGDLSKIMPELKTGVHDTGVEISNMVSSIADLVTGSRFKADLPGIFETNNHVLRRFGEAAGSIISAFENIIVAAEPVTKKLADIGAKVAEAFDRKTSKGRKDGSLAAFFQEALDVAGQLFTILGNLASGIGGIFRAAAPSGKGVLDDLQTLTKRFADFVNSKDGQAKLRNLFEEGRKVFHALTEALAPVASALLGIVTKVESIGAAFAQVIRDNPLLGKILTGVAVGGVLGKLTGISPLGVLGKGAGLLGAAGSALGAGGGAGLAAAAVPVAVGAAAVGVGAAAGYGAYQFYKRDPQTKKDVDKDVSDIKASFRDLSKSLSQIWGVIKRDAAAVWKAIGPAVIEIVRNFITGLTKIINGIVKIISGIFKVIAGVMTGNWSEAWEGIKDILKGAWLIIQGIFKAQFQAVAEKIVAFAKNAKGKFDGFIEDVKQKFRDFKTDVGEIWDGFVDYISAAPGKIMRALNKAWNTVFAKPFKALWSTLRDDIGAIWDKLQDAFKKPINLVIDVVNGFDGQVNAVLAKVVPGNEKHFLPDQIPHLATGGTVPGGWGGGDRVPLMAEPGEFMVNKDAARTFYPLLRALNGGDKTQLKGMTQYAAGGGSIFDTIKHGVSDVGRTVKHAVGGAIDLGGDVLQAGTSLLRQGVADAFRKVFEGLVNPLLKKLPDTVVGDFGAGTVNTIGDRVLRFIGKKESSGADAATGSGSSAPYNGRGGAAQWKGIVDQVLGLLHQSLSLDGGVLRRIQFESGGNPRAINLWDSNAKAGHPSKGLMQTIDGTFNAYAGPYRSRGIYDPLANIYAGVNYALHRYGSVSAIDPLVRPRGYDSGGILEQGITSVVNATGKPESVLTPEETEIYKRMVRQLGHGSGQLFGDITITDATAAQALLQQASFALDGVL